MKKLITTAMATGLLVGTSANAMTVPAIDRDAATVTEAEGVAGEGGALIAVLIAAAVIAGIIILIADNEDPGDLPTSP